MLERASVDVSHPQAVFWVRKQFSKRKFYSTRQELIEFIIIKKLAILRLSRKPAGAQTVNLFRELEKIESSCSLIKRGHLSLYQFFLYTSEYERREEKLILFLDLSLTSVVKMIVTSLWFADRPIWKISHKRWLWCAISKPERTQKTIDGYFAYFMSPFDLRLLSLGIKNSQFACGGEQHLVCKATLPRRNFALKKYQIWTAKGHQIPKYSFPIDDYIFFCRCPASVLSAASKWRFSCDPTSFSCQSGLQIWIGGVYGRTHCWKFKLWLSFPCGWWWYNQSYKTV